MTPSLVEMTLPVQGSPAVQIVLDRSHATVEGPSFAQVLQDMGAGEQLRQTLATGEGHAESEEPGTHAGTEPTSEPALADPATPDMHEVSGMSPASLPQVLRAFARAQGLDESTVTRVFAPVPDHPTTIAGSPVSEEAVVPPPPLPALSAQVASAEPTPGGGATPLGPAHIASGRPAMPPMPSALEAHSQHHAAQGTRGVSNASSPHARPSPNPGAVEQPMTELQASDDRAIRDARSRIQVDAIEASIEPADAVPGALRALSPANPVKSVAVAPPVHPGGSPSLEARAPTDASAGPQPGLGPRVDVGVAAMDDWTPTRIEVLSVPLEPAEAPAREGTDPVARREHALQVSTQIAELLAERVIARIRQGHWQVRLMLSPARLGFIDVQLEMRRGALEATFTASQASTREVLADNLWRLRDTLSESGMLIAHMSLASDFNGHGGGFLTPQRHYSGSASPSDAALNEPSIIPTTDTPPQGLLDVRV